MNEVSDIKNIAGKCLLALEETKQNQAETRASIARASIARASVSQPTRSSIAPPTISVRAVSPPRSPGQQTRSNSTASEDLSLFFYLIFFVNDYSTIGIFFPFHKAHFDPSKIEAKVDPSVCGVAKSNCEFHFPIYLSYLYDAY